MRYARDELISALAGLLQRRSVDHTLRVCVDGPDAAGKTTFADDLAAHLSRFRPAIRLSIDRFHHPEAVRHRRGSLSPEGFYYDSYNHDVVVEAVLRPLGPGGDGCYLPGMFNYQADRATGEVSVRAPEAATGPGCWSTDPYTGTQSVIPVALQSQEVRRCLRQLKDVDV